MCNVISLIPQQSHPIKRLLLSNSYSNSTVGTAYKLSIWARPAFLNLNYSATRFFQRPLIFGQKTEKKLDANFTFLSTPHPFNKRDLKTFSGHMFKTKIFLSTKFVSVKLRNMFFCIFFLIQQITYDPFKIFHNPLAGRDPAVEKHWARPVSFNLFVFAEP